jgi:hypothetical protein
LPGPRSFLPGGSRTSSTGTGSTFRPATICRR